MDQDAITLVKAAIDKHTDAFDQFQKSQNQRFDTLQDRLELLDANRNTPGRSEAKRIANPEYSKHFCSWMRRRGQSPHDEEQMQRLEGERKDITVGSAAGGGYAVPEEIGRMVHDLMLRLSPVTRLIPPQRVGTSDYKELINIRGTTSGWSNETGTRGASNTPQLREVVPTHGELYPYPQVSEWSLDDIFFNVENWLVKNVAAEFAYQLGDAVIRGNGTSKPTGMINTTPVTTADWASPIRAAAAYQYIDATASPFGISGDKLIDTVYTLNSEYRAGAAWAMNSATAGSIRKLKDSQNQYLWQSSLIQGQPPTLLGYPVEI